jgi:hypothetical protein
MRSSYSKQNKKTDFIHQRDEIGLSRYHPFSRKACSQYCGIGQPPVSYSPTTPRWKCASMARTGRHLSDQAINGRFNVLLYSSIE